MTRGHVPELDGIRGIAILLVLLFHFSLNASGPLANVLSCGWCGVDLFFVLSGCLITGILLESKGSDNYFRVFYARRALRILPLYFAAVAGIFFILLPAVRMLGKPGPWTAIPSSEQIWYWLHISNWRTAYGHFAGEPIGHFWSLSIEEQFYLAWPLVIFLCPSRYTLWVCITAFVACLGFRNLPEVQALQHQHPDFVYRITPARIDALAAGAAIAVAVRRPGFRQFAVKWARPGALIGVIAIAVLFAGIAAAGETGRTLMARFGYSLIALGFCGIVAYALTNSGASTIAPRLLRSKFLRSFGAYSYAIYVLHPLLAHFVRNGARKVFPGFLIPAAPVAIGVGLSYFAGWCSWHLLEKRFWAMKDRFKYRAAE